MRKSKVLKALLVFGMSVATATSVAVTAGCGHTHTYDENEWGKDGSKHWRVATCEEHPGEKFDEADHVDENNDKECDVCGGAISSGTTPGGTTPGGDDKHTHTWSTTYDADHADANGHWHWCTAGDDCDETDAKDGQAAHVDANGDNVCDTCGYSGGELPADYTALASKEGVTKLVSNSFLVSGTLEEFDNWRTPGFYTGYQDGGAADTHRVEIKDGKANLVKPSDSKVSTYAYADFGGAVGVIEGYLEVTLNGTGGYTPVQFYGSTAEKADTEVFGFRLDNKNNKWQYRKDGGSAVDPETAAPATDKSTTKFYFSYNTVNNQITVKTGGKDGSAFVTDLSVNTTGIKGIKFSSQGGGTATIAIDNLILVYTPASIDEYKTTVTNKVNAAETFLNGLINTSTAKSAYDSAIATADTQEACDAAYDAYYSAVLGDYKTSISAKKNDYPSTNYTKAENQSAYEAAITKFDNAVNGAKTLESVKKAGETLVSDMSGIKDDSYYNKQDVVLTVSDGVNTQTITVKEGDVISQADILAKVTVPAGSAIVGYYYNSDMATDEVTEFPITLTESKTIYVKIVAGNSDKGVYTYTVSGSQAVAEKAEGSFGDPSKILTVGTSYNSTDFKFSGNAEALTIKLSVKQGQTIKLAIDGFTGSTGNASGVKVETESTNIATTDTTTIEFASTTTVSAQTHGEITYTVSADGDVTITIKRSVSKTARVTKLVITVADAE
ncbi:MAG: hypothetical protein K2N30_03625 [Clostridia bacterium]|nr:hypothetical protein [Clostridia bacterium]